MRKPWAQAADFSRRTSTSTQGVARSMATNRSRRTSSSGSCGRYFRSTGTHPGTSSLKVLTSALGSQGRQVRHPVAARAAVEAEAGDAFADELPRHRQIPDKRQEARSGGLTLLSPAEDTPADSGTFEVTANQVQVGTYPAGQVVSLGSFWHSSQAIEIQGANVPKAYAYIPSTR